MRLFTRKFQEGGPMEGGQDPMQQLLQVAAQAVQSQDCQAAMAVCQALIQMAQGGPEGAPQDGPEEGPEGGPEGTPAMRYGGSAPAFRAGGKFVGVVKTRINR